MGYESKIYFIDRSEYKNHVTGKTLVDGLVIAEYDLGKVGYNNKEFFDAFKNPIDYKLWLLDVDETGDEIGMDVDEDKYGEHIKSADLQTLLDALKVAESREHYLRFPPLIAMLQVFINERDAWNSSTHTLQAVHYGH